MNFNSKNVMYRYFLVVAFFSIFTFLLVAFRLFTIMTKEKDYWVAVNEKFRNDNIDLPPKRGQILADNGEALAASIPEYVLYFDFMSSEKDEKKRKLDQQRRDSILYLKLDSISEGMHEIFPDIQPRTFKANMLKGRKKESKYWPIYGRNRISYTTFTKVKQLPIFCKGKLGGLTWRIIESRKNPYGQLATRTVGELSPGQNKAKSGLELGFDSILRGVKGRAHRHKVRNRYINITDQLPENGKDVQTTLNIRMQDICEQALGERLQEIQDQDNGKVKYGMCILMEVKTGDIKAITSLSRCANGQFKEIENKAVSNLMEPGSVFKPMSFLVAFDDGYLHLDDEVDTKNGIVKMYGRSMRDHNSWSGGYGLLTARQCIQKSSNVGVSYFIDRFYQDNPQRFIDHICRTGVMDDLHLPLKGYAIPTYKSPKKCKLANQKLMERYNQRVQEAKAKGLPTKTIKKPTLHLWSKTDLPWMSIGYVTQIPPISTLAFYGGIANGGKMMRPRFVTALLQDGKVVKEFAPIVQRKEMASPEAVKNVQTCLREVVTLGVGKAARSPYVEIAGKTGTAQVWKKNGRTRDYFVSFAGFFPYRQPKYAIIVCIRKEGVAGGNSCCGPVLRKVAERVMALETTSDYQTAKDTCRTALPMVNNGNMTACASVLRELNLKKVQIAIPEAKDLVWGYGHTTPQHVEVSQRVEAPHHMPNVIGYGLRDALFRLESLGLRVKFQGVGIVQSQSIAAQQPIHRGEEVMLTMAMPGNKVAPTPPKASTPPPTVSSVDSARDEEIVGRESSPETPHTTAPKTSQNKQKTPISQKRETAPPAKKTSPHSPKKNKH